MTVVAAQYGTGGALVTLCAGPQHAGVKNAERKAGGILLMLRWDGVMPVVMVAEVVRRPRERFRRSAPRYQ